MGYLLRIQKICQEILNTTHIVNKESLLIKLVFETIIYKEKVNMLMTLGTKIFSKKIQI